MTDEPVVVLEISDTLDLHAFQPGEVSELVPDYLEACRERGILRVRIIHGKGKGFLREKVQGILRRLDSVRAFRLADREGGDWGSTLVELKPMADAGSEGMSGR